MYEDKIGHFCSLLEGNCSHRKNQSFVDPSSQNDYLGHFHLNDMQLLESLLQQYYRGLYDVKSAKHARTATVS